MVRADTPICIGTMAQCKLVQNKACDSFVVYEMGAPKKPDKAIGTSESHWSLGHLRAESTALINVWI